jgi:hypothetical protein
MSCARNRIEILRSRSYSRRGPSSVFDVNPYGIIVRKAPLDGCEQILISRSLRPRVVHLEHHPKCSGHPGVTKMYSTISLRYFWRSMYKDVENNVRQCTSCAKNRVQERKRVSLLKLFPATETLEFVAIDILGPLPESVHGNRYLLLITHRSSKLTRTIPMRMTTALAVAKAFCAHWVFFMDLRSSFLAIMALSLFLSSS